MMATCAHLLVSLVVRLASEDEETRSAEFRADRQHTAGVNRPVRVPTKATRPPLPGAALRRLLAA